MSRSLRDLAILLTVLFVSALLVSCETRSSNSGKIQVVTTATMVTDLISIIGGDHIEVTGLMGEEVDPHSYDPVFRDVNALQNADAVFYVGLHLEGKMQNSLEALANNRRHSYALASGVDVNDLLAPQQDFPGAYDPHIWGDPRLWKQCALFAAEKLAEIDPPHAGDYRANAKAYATELDQLHRWSHAQLQQIPEDERILVSSHDAFFYFGRAYRFKVYGLQGLSTESEVGMGGRLQLINFLKSSPIKALFAETSVNDKGIVEVARQVGIKISEEKLYSDAMGKRGDIVTVNHESYDRGTYLGMQKHNINAIVKALLSDHESSIRP